MDELWTIRAEHDKALKEKDEEMEKIVQENIRLQNENYTVNVDLQNLQQDHFNLQLNMQPGQNGIYDDSRSMSTVPSQNPAVDNVNNGPAIIDEDVLPLEE